MTNRLASYLRVGFAVFAMFAGHQAVANAAPIYWTDWQAGGFVAGVGYVATGVIITPTATVNVTYTNARGIGFLQTGAAGEIDYWANRFDGRDDSISPYTSSAVDNSPAGTDIVALQFAGNQTLSFSQAIGNPVFSYVSLNGNGYGFLNQPFEILSYDAGLGSGGIGDNACGYWGCGTSYQDSIAVSGGIEYRLLGTGEPHGTLRFNGAFDSVTWESLSNEYWNGFTVGVQGTAQEVFPEAPEPSSLFLLGTGLVAAARKMRARK